MATVKAVHLLCGYDLNPRTLEEYKGSIDLVRADYVAMHMLEQCLRRRQGKATEPLHLHPYTTKEQAEKFRNDGWLVFGDKSYLDGKTRYTVKDPKDY